jgi:hypothetical protein
MRALPVQPEPLRLTDVRMISSQDGTGERLL